MSTFERRGIDLGNESGYTLDTSAVANAVVDRLNQDEPSNPAIKEFHETYRHVDWQDILKNANGNIDIVAYYYDSWINANYDELVDFFSRPGTKMRLFVANPEDNVILDNVHRLFPEYTRE